MRKLDATEHYTSGASTPDCVDEFALIKHICAGEHDCFRYFVDRYKGPVYRMALRRLGDKSESEDLAQEVFLKAFRALPSFRFEATFFTWIVRIALNQIHTRQTSKSRELLGLEAAQNATDSMRAHSSTGCPHTSHVQTETLDRYRNAIEALDRLYAEPLILIAFEGRSYEQVAACLEIPIGTVRSRISKARRLLKEALVDT